MIDMQTTVAELEADNSRLRRLLDEGGAAGELRHRLRNTLAMLRIIIRKSADTNRDLDSYVAHLEDRVDALTRAQAASDTHGWVDLHGLIADELQKYAAQEGEQYTLSGSAVRLQPRAGQILGIAIHELSVNAVEHGALGKDSGRVEISWNVAEQSDHPIFHFIWKEIGLTDVTQPSKAGFGTEILTQTLPYQLKAETKLAFDAAGFSCKIIIPFSQHVGEIKTS